MSTSSLSPDVLSKFSLEKRISLLKSRRLTTTPHTLPFIDVEVSQVPNPPPVFPAEAHEAPRTLPRTTTGGFLESALKERLARFASEKAQREQAAAATNTTSKPRAQPKPALASMVEFVKDDKAASSRWLFIQGSRGCGKTTLLKQFEHKLWNEFKDYAVGATPQYLPIYIDLRRLLRADEATRADPRLLVNEQTDQTILFDDLAAFRTQNLKPVWLLDGFEEMDILPALGTTLFRCGIVVLTCPSFAVEGIIGEDITKLSGFYTQVCMQLQCIKPTALQQYISSYLDQSPNLKKIGTAPQFRQAILFSDDIADLVQYPTFIPILIESMDHLRNILPGCQKAFTRVFSLSRSACEGSAAASEALGDIIEKYMQARWEQFRSECNLALDVEADDVIAASRELARSIASKMRKHGYETADMTHEDFKSLLEVSSTNPIGSIKWIALQLVPGTRTSVSTWEFFNSSIKRYFTDTESSTDVVQTERKETSVTVSAESKSSNTWDDATPDIFRDGFSTKNIDVNANANFGLCVSPDGTKIAAGGLNCSVTIYDLSTTTLFHLRGHRHAIRWVDFHPSGDEVVSGSDDRTLRIWDLANRRSKLTIDVGGAVTAVRYTRDGRHIVAACEGTTKVINAATGEIVATHRDPSRSICVDASPDGTLVAIGSWDTTVTLWDWAKGSVVHTCRGHARKVTSSVSYSPDGTLVASGSEDTTVRLWDTKTGQCRHVLRGHATQVNITQFSPDGTILASGDCHEGIRLWNVETGKCIAEIPVGSPTYSIAFSPDAKFFIYGNHSTYAYAVSIRNPE